MRPFFFQMTAEPHANNPQGEGIAGANAYIWVFETSMERARIRAINHLHDHGWRVTEVGFAEDVPPWRIARLGSEELRELRFAEREGVSSTLATWPKTPKPGVFSVAPLEKPPK